MDWGKISEPTRKKFDISNVRMYVQISEMIDNFRSGSLKLLLLFGQIAKKSLCTHKKINLLGISKLNQQCWWQLWGLTFFI